ncbi:MAG: chaperone modulator CbpM [Cellvibrionaceae bacterium]
MLVHITTQELCQRIDLSEETLEEIVEHGIVEPRGEKPEEWTFDIDYVWVVRRAARLHRDLGIDWAGIALVLELLNERERLVEENRMLQRRLRRFEV